MKSTAAESYHSTQTIHLGHLRRGLGDKVNRPCDQISLRDLDRHLRERLAQRTPTTVGNERVTIKLFFQWLVTLGHLAQSPAAGLATIKGSGELPPFRTMGEIEQIISRGGLWPKEAADLWNGLYLSPEEIASLLQTVRQRQASDFSYLLHAIPAYTGMRRGEILRLTWQDMDFDRRIVFARSRKQSRRKTMTVRSIDMHPELTTELLAWRKQRPRGQYILCLPKSTEPLSLDKANTAFWQPMRDTSWCLDRRRNWYKVGFHTYRHSFVSNLAARGVDQRVIDEWVGHTTDAMRSAIGTCSRATDKRRLPAFRWRQLQVERVTWLPRTDLLSNRKNACGTS